MVKQLTKMVEESIEIIKTKNKRIEILRESIKIQEEIIDLLETH